MQPMQHQMMGYDRAITMFSPEGRLLQVEYAKKTVKQGSSAIGIACKDGVVLVTDKRVIDPLVITEAIEKIFMIDDHIMATASGIIPDARVLVEHLQVKAQQAHITYDTPADTLTMVKDVCNLMQNVTQSGGYRPFGVSLLIGSVDKGSVKLFKTDPVGIYYQYKATVIGEKEEQIDEILHKEYKESMSVDDALALAISALKRTLEDFKAERVDAATIRADSKTMVSLSQADIQKIVDNVK